ncbi:MAG: hypothetical protein ACRC62_33535 [Microcoleus sp.]
MAYPLQTVTFTDGLQIEDAWNLSTDANYETPGLVSWEQLNQLAGKKPVLAPTAKILERDRINLLTIGETYTLPTGADNEDPIQWIVPPGTGNVTVDGNVYAAPTGNTASGHEVYWDGTKYVAIASSAAVWIFAPASGTNAVTVVTALAPTANEIQVWAAAQLPAVKNRHIYYTGTATTTDTPTYIWWVDSAGAAKTLESPTSVVEQVKTEFVFRNNATQNTAPTSTEFPNPTNEDAAIIVLNDGRKEYYVYASGAWTQRGSVAAAVADGRNFLASRTNATANVEPTTTEVPSPKSGDTAAVYLNNGNIEQWFHNGTAWSLIYTVNPTTLDGNTVFVARTTATTGSAPTNTEVVAPVNGDTAIVFLSNGLREYWSYGTAWALAKTEGDNRSDFIFRTNATQNTTPTSTEFPNPINNDAAIVVLNDGRKEYYAYVSGTWVQRGAIAPFAVDGRCILVPRTNATANTAPTTTEVTSPKSGDTAIVFLTNGLKEYWSYTTSWALTKTDGTLPPASQHDFGLPTPLAISPTSGVQAHLEGGAGYSIVASTLPDNWEGTLLNTTSAARTVTFSGFAGAFMRDGTGATLTSPLSVPANSEYRLESVINGPNSWLNVIPQGGGGSAGGSVTVQSGSHAFGNTGTGLSSPFSVTFATPFNNVPTVELTYQWNYNASSNGSALSPPMLLEGISKTGFSYRINGSRNTLDRVMWTAVDPQITAQAGTTVLTTRAITGSITSTGYDGVTLPYLIPLAAGLVLNTVFLNGTATTNFDANTGIVRITPAGADVAVTHTTRVGATFNSRQVVSTRNFINSNGGGVNGLSMGAANSSLQISDVTLQTGDLVELKWRFNSSAAQDQFISFLVAPSTTQRTHTWIDRSEEWAFGATLSTTVSYSSGSYASSPTLVEAKVWRDAANKVVVPTASTVLTPRAITGSITSTGYDGVDLPYQITLPIGQVLDTITVTGGTVASSIQIANAGIIKIKPQGADVVVSHTTKAGATYQGMQVVASQSGLATAIGSSAVNVNFGVTLQAGDRITIHGDYADDANQAYTFILGYVRPNTTTRAYCYPAANHDLIFAFPATLTNTVPLTHGGGNTSFRMRAFVIERNAANGFVIPTATTIATKRTLTATGGLNTFKGATSATIFDNFSIPVQLDLSPNKQLDTVSPAANVSIINRLTGQILVTATGADLAMTYTEIAAPLAFDFIEVDATADQTTGLTVGSPVLFSSPSIIGNIPFSNGVFTLSAGKTYTLMGDAAWIGGTELITQWRDITNNVLIGKGGNIGVAGRSTVAQASIKPATTITVRLEIIYVNGVTSINSQANGRGARAVIEQVASDNFIAPVGTNIATTYNITVNNGTNGNFTGFEGIGPQPFILTGMSANQEVDAFPTVAGVSLLNRQAGLFSVNRAAGAGNLALTGITFRNLGVKSKYFGTADNQPGDAGSTNGGHTFTQRLLTGNGITTANHSTFTLSGGIYRVRYAVTHHKGPNCWSARALYVNGGEVTSIYTGSDGSNWESGGDLEWIVDATSASQTIQMKRTASSGSNGNVDCWIAIDREEGYALPEGYVTRDTCVLTAGSGTFAGGATTANIPTNTAQYIGFTVPSGQVLQSVTSNNANVIAGAVDPKAGSVFITVNNGATATTLTPTFAAISARSIYTIANSGVWVDLGTIGIRIPATGNKSLQIHAVSGSITVDYMTWLTWDSTRAPTAGRTVASADTTNYLESSWNFGNIGNNQEAIISDSTNNRRYRARCMINAGYNACHYLIEEIT